MDVIIPSLVGVKMGANGPLTLIKPLISSGMLSALMTLCKTKTGQTDLLIRRSSPNRIAVGNMTNKPMARKTGMLVVMDDVNMLRSRK